MAGKTHLLSDVFLNDLSTTERFLALFTTSPNDQYTAAVPGMAVEIGYGTSARQPLLIGTWSAIFDGPTIGRRRTYDASVNWVNWDGTTGLSVVALAIMDVAVAGEMRYFAALPTPILVTTGETVTIDSGVVIVQED